MVEGRVYVRSKIGEGRPKNAKSETRRPSTRLRKGVTLTREDVGFRVRVMSGTRRRDDKGESSAQEKSTSGKETTLFRVGDATNKNRALKNVAAEKN